MSVSRAVAFVAVLLALAPTAAAARSSDPTIVTVRADEPIGPTAANLGGFGWNTASLEGVEPLAPPAVRIDGSLESASKGPHDLDLTALLGRVAAVRSIGAEPIVILSYMPAWLGSPNAHGRDPTKVPPSDPAAWQALIEEVVHALATAPEPAYRFEVWNEPDNPVFFQDLPSAFVDMAVRTHTAVAKVEHDTGLPLQIGGPALTFPEPVYAIPYVNAMKDKGLPLDFLSWHYYGNTPFFGPDGAEGLLPAPLMPSYLALGQPNPLTSPTIYSQQIDFMRALRDALVSGSDLHPSLVIDEWNLSAGGYDLRHDTNEGAAFAAGTLIEMERATLDEAEFYRAASTVDPPHAGDWGVVDPAGERKPVWSVFDAWRQTSGTHLTVDGDDPMSGLWARASDDGTAVHVLIVSWSALNATDRTVSVKVPGGCGEVRRIDSDSSSFDATAPVTNVDGAIALDVPQQSVTWLTVSAACLATPTTVGTDLARTGGDEAVLTAVMVMALALAIRRAMVRAR